VELKRTDRKRLKAARRRRRRLAKRQANGKVTSDEDDSEQEVETAGKMKMRGPSGKLRVESEEESGEE
jgi:hypothetical protein